MIFCLDYISEVPLFLRHCTEDNSATAKVHIAWIYFSRVLW